MDKDELGRAGEALAVRLLADEGYTVLDRNWRGTRGELDIVALNGRTLVGVEVKTRSSHRFGTPASAITEQKVARLRRLLGQWLVEHRGSLPHFAEVRLDAIAIVMPHDDGGSSARPPLVEHLIGIS